MRLIAQCMCPEPRESRWIVRIECQLPEGHQATLDVPRRCPARAADDSSTPSAGDLSDTSVRGWRTHIHVPLSGYLATGEDNHMTSDANEPHTEETEDRENADGESAPGVETTTSDDGGSTFEPEEDPQGHDE